VARLVDQGYAELLGDRSLRLTHKGRELAVSIVRRHRLAERLLVDVIVTEVVLPDMSGHQLLASLHAQGIAADATVIVATECRDPDWMVRSWELGASAHLTKPIGPEAIADVIAREVRPRQVVLSS
jgi:DNA-binding response OmpR family regulator